MNILDTINKYFNTLSKVGYIKVNEIKSLLIYLFLTNFNARQSSLKLNDDDMREYNNILSCLKKKSCILNDADALCKLTNNQAWIYSTTNNVVTAPDNTLTIIGGHVGSGIIQFIQNGQLVGSFNVNQDDNTSIVLSGGGGDNKITFSKPTETEYFNGDVIGNLLFEWDYTYSTTDQKVEINGKQMSDITPTTKTYNVENVSNNTTCRVVRKNFDGTSIEASRSVTFYNRFLVGTADTIPESMEEAIESLESYPAKSGTYRTYSDKAYYIIVAPSNIVIKKVVKDAFSEDIWDPEYMTTKEDMFTYNDVKYNVYYTISSDPLEDYINVTI